MPIRARPALPRGVTSRPSSSTAPRLGRNAPAMMLNRVDFPAPFGPISPRSRPAGAVKLTSSSADSPPNSLPIPRTSSCAGLAGTAQPLRQRQQATRQREDDRDEDDGVDQRLVVPDGEQ